jgi:hypothetical protein
MRQRVCSQLEAAGATRVNERDLCWQGHALSVRIRPTGYVELALSLGPLSAGELVGVIGRNPETGWAHALTSDGRLARRLMTPPVVWVNTARLASAIDGLVQGLPEASRAPQRMPLLGVLPDIGGPDELWTAAAAAYLLRGAWDETDARHTLGGHAVLWGVQIVGSDLQGRAGRSAEETRMLWALMTHPDAAACLLETLNIRPVAASRQKPANESLGSVLPANHGDRP